MDHADFELERIAPGLVGEPSNAISNVSFPAGSALWRRSRAKGGAAPASLMAFIVFTVLVNLAVDDGFALPGGYLPGFGCGYPTPTPAPRCPARQKAGPWRRA